MIPFARPDRQARYLVPEVVQTSMMDCGPAALQALVAGFAASPQFHANHILTETFAFNLLNLPGGCRRARRHRSVPRGAAHAARDDTDRLTGDFRHTM